MSSNRPEFGAPIVSPPKAWQAALGELQLQVTSDTFEMYLHPTRFLAHEDGTFLIAVPNAFVKDWLEFRLNRVVKRTLRDIVNREVEVKYTVQPQPTREAEDAAPAPLLDYAAGRELIPAPSDPSQNGTSLSVDYTFSTFIVGSNNRLAHAAATSVADQPGGRYNPLFIYSGVGLGKTHLMHAIGHKTRQAGYKAVYVSCEMFTNELVAAIRTNTQEEFRAKYRTSDLLLVDDIQFLVGKPSTQEEFFHTFNALYEAGRQVVLACDRPPKAMSALESRLRSRFEWGLIVDIQPPDLENRVAILQAKAAIANVQLSNDVLLTIAQLVPTNVRELEGALTKIIAHANLTGAVLTPATVEVILQDIVPRKAEIAPDELVLLVARQYGFSAEELASVGRKQALVRARQVAMYLLREDMQLSYPRIGELLGGRDHATAVHSVRKISDLLNDDEVLKREIDGLREQMVVSERVPVRIRRRT